MNCFVYIKYYKTVGGRGHIKFTDIDINVYYSVLSSFISSSKDLFCFKIQFLQSWLNYFFVILLFLYGVNFGFFIKFDTRDSGVIIKGSIFVYFTGYCLYLMIFIKKGNCLVSVTNGDLISISLVSRLAWIIV